jgi:hypothetical protein
VIDFIVPKEPASTFANASSLSCRAAQPLLLASSTSCLRASRTGWALSLLSTCWILLLMLRTKVRVVAVVFLCVVASMRYTPAVALVIELNPFGKPDGLGTGTCLFDRCSAADMRRLFDEDGGEFELRMESHAPSDDVMRKLLRDGPLKAFLEGEGVLCE